MPQEFIILDANKRRFYGKTVNTNHHGLTYYWTKSLKSAYTWERAGQPIAKAREIKMKTSHIIEVVKNYGQPNERLVMRFSGGNKNDGFEAMDGDPTSGNKTKPG